MNLESENHHKFSLFEPSPSKIGTLKHFKYPEIFDDYLNELKTSYTSIKIDFYQSNVEGELINKIQEIGFTYDGIILNAAAYTHTSVGIADAIAAIQTPVIEVHISNIYKREEVRHNSLISKNVEGVICGFGLKSYALALEALI